MYHPGPARIDCQDCLLWCYDMKKGERMVEEFGPSRELRPVSRMGQKPDCWDCPKESPERAHLHELSDRNRECVALYERRRGTGFATMTEAERSDPLLQENFAIIASIYEAWHRMQLGEAIAVPLARIVLASRR